MGRQAACREGYHTLDINSRQALYPAAPSYDPATIACALCYLRPTVPCPSRTCPPGFIMLVRRPSQGKRRSD